MLARPSRSRSGLRTSMVQVARFVAAVFLVLPLPVAVGQPPRDSNELAKGDLDKLWSDLASKDATIARRAVISMAAARGISVPYLKQHLVPRPKQKPERLSQLIRDLDSNDKKTRQVASKELDKLGDVAEPALRRALAEGHLSDRLRSAVEGLLVKLQDRQLSANQLRTVRVMQILEMVGSHEAEAVLRDLAEGSARRT